MKKSLLILLSFILIACQKEELPEKNDKPQEIKKEENLIPLKKKSTYKNKIEKKSNVIEEKGNNSESSNIQKKDTLIISLNSEENPSEINEKLVKKEISTISLNSTKLNIESNKKLVKLSLNNKNSYTFNSSIHIIQSCGKENYLEINENLISYVDLNSLKIGMIKTINNENIPPNSQIKLVTTTPLLSANTKGAGNTTLNCVNNNSFSLIDNSTGVKYLENINTKTFNLEFNGKGDILLKNLKVKDFYIQKTSLGALDILGEIENLDIHNSGIGQTTVEKATNVKILNSGGEINIRNDSKLLNPPNIILQNVVIFNKKFK